MKVNRYQPWKIVDINECEVCLRCWFDTGNRATRIESHERNEGSIVRIHPVVCDDCLPLSLCLSSTPNLKGYQIDTKKTQPVTASDSQILSGQKAIDISKRSSANKESEPNSGWRRWWELWNTRKDNQND